MPNVSTPQLVFAVVAGSLLAHVFLLLAQGQGALLQRNWYGLWSWLTGAGGPRREGFADVATAYATQYGDYGTWAEPPASAPVVTADYDPTDYVAVDPVVAVPAVPVMTAPVSAMSMPVPAISMPVNAAEMATFGSPI